MRKEKTIYDLELHETMQIEDALTEVTRVAGGWIYKYYNYSRISSVFVPFNNEFENK